MNRNINYSWWCEDFDSIPSEFVEVLETAAIAHIFELIPQGYTQGTLFLELEDICFRGSWKITENDF